MNPNHIIRLLLLVPCLSQTAYNVCEVVKAGALSRAAHFCSAERNLDFGLLKRRGNFGYSDEEIQRCFSAVPRMDLDETELDHCFLTPVPPLGVHPRVTFNACNLPVIRQQLETTEAGRAAIIPHLFALIVQPNVRFIDGWTLLDDPSSRLIRSILYPSNVAHLAMGLALAEQLVTTPSPS